jgi:NADH:ubiquinone oxidoreductase subunit 3 (subunit A)
MADYAYVGFFLLVGIAFTVVTMWISWLVRPWRANRWKAETYECGETPFGISWRRFRANWFLYALIFVVFDVEIVFLYPWAKVLSPMARVSPAMGRFAFYEMMVFIAILVVAYVYAWRKGAFVWD